jgi:hypothetical protein
VRLNVPIASDDPGPFERLDARSGLLKYRKGRLREPFAILEINANNVDATFADAPDPRGLQAVPEIEGDDAISNRGDANASSGKDGVTTRAMVGRSAVRKGQSGVPSMSARLSLRRKQRCIGKQFGFLGNNNVSGRSFKHRLIERLPGVAIARLNGPKAFGNPPPVGINNGAEWLNINGAGVAGSRIAFALFARAIRPAPSSAGSLGRQQGAGGSGLTPLKIGPGVGGVLQEAVQTQSVGGTLGLH